MKKILSLACAFLMGISCAGISANAEFNPDSLNFEDWNLEDFNAEDFKDLESLKDLEFNFDFTDILSKVCEKLEDYMQKSGIEAEVLLEDGTISVNVSCDYAEAREKVTAFLEENGIDPNQVKVEIMEKAKELIPLLLGDATGDESVNILDVIVLNKAAMGKENLTEEQLQAIDLNGNGKPDSGDSMTLLKYIVGLIETLTA